MHTIVAQIGCGYWGPNLLRNFFFHPNCTVKYLAEVSFERRVYVEKSYPSIKTTENCNVIFEDSEIDAVIISTPACTHYKLTKDALQANKHVLVEKPLAMSTQEADELVNLAESRNLILMVGHTFLFNNAVRYIYDLIHQGELGEIYYIYSQRLNLGQLRSDVNAWWNLAPHDISILLYFMKEEMPIQISSHGMSYIQSGIEDVVFSTLTWKNGMTAQIQVSWLDPGKVRKMTLVGSHKMITYDDISDDKITIFDKGFDKVPRSGEQMDYDGLTNYKILKRWGNILVPYFDFQEPLKLEIDHFLSCVQTGQTPITHSIHGKNVVSILEAGQLSLKQGGVGIKIG